VRTAVAHVEVDTQPDGDLMVRWEFEGDPVPVDVATGRTPNQIDHRHETTVAASESRVRIAAGREGRWFVSVAPHGGGPAVVAADRRVPFEGIGNFRDLGGYRTRSGGTVRWGVVFRADALHGLIPSDMALYEQLGLRAVFDLRGDPERQERPNPVPSKVFAISGWQRTEGPPRGAPTVATPADGERILHEIYVRLIDQAAEQIGRLYTHLVSEDGLPAVFHCHAGKDRTGIVAALLLEALEVERGTILDDYELTARYRLRTHQESTFQRLVDAGITREAAAGVLTTPRWAMQSALDHRQQRYGDIDAYLTGPAMMRAEDVEALRRRLLVRSS